MGAWSGRSSSSGWVGGGLWSGRRDVCGPRPAALPAYLCPPALTHQRPALPTLARQVIAAQRAADAARKLAEQADAGEQAVRGQLAAAQAQVAELQQEVEAAQVVRTHAQRLEAKVSDLEGQLAASASQLEAALQDAAAAKGLVTGERERGEVLEKARAAAVADARRLLGAERELRFSLEEAQAAAEAAKAAAHEQEVGGWVGWGGCRGGEAQQMRAGARRPCTALLLMAPAPAAALLAAQVGRLAAERSLASVQEKMQALSAELESAKVRLG